ncbi:MAG: flagellar basal-body rod protein FlgF [Acidobacteriota bacterium]
MDHGLYTTYLGMRARQRALDVIANNIANASTPGFKTDRLRFQLVEAPELTAKVTINPAGAPSGNQSDAASNRVIDPTPTSTHGRNVGLIAGSVTDHSNGLIRQTGRTLDVALDGDGLLVVQTAQGERYTRAGSLRLNEGGQLVTQSGDLVLGEKGSITIPPGEVTISDNGTISVKGQQIDRLKLVRFATPQSELLKEGTTLFTASDAAAQLTLPATSTRVIQGSLEMSNVDAISEMASMIQNSREFEALQRSITTLMNDLGRKVAGELGRL